MNWKGKSKQNSTYSYMGAQVTPKMLHKPLKNVFQCNLDNWTVNSLSSMQQVSYNEPLLSPGRLSPSADRWQAASSTMIDSWTLVTASDVSMKALTGWLATIMQLSNVRVNDHDCSRVTACFKKGLQCNSLKSCPTLWPSCEVRSLIIGAHHWGSRANNLESRLAKYVA